MIIFLILFILALAGALFIVIRKFPYLAAIDTKAIPKEKQAKVKEQILLDRMRRKTGGWWQKQTETTKPFFAKISASIHGAYTRLQELEKQYQKTLKEQVRESGEGVDQRIAKLLREAGELVNAEKYAEAEKKYIEVISLDVKNADAYAGLGDVYFMSKDYHQAKETLEHLVKISPERASAYLELAQVYKAMENLEKSVENAKKALGFEPNHPKTLDFLLEIAILNHNRELAEETLKKLMEVNPENEKLTELQDRVREMKSAEKDTTEVAEEKKE